MLMAASADSASAASAETVEEVTVQLSQADYDELMTMLSGLLSVQWYTLLSVLILIGVALVVVFVVTVRRF